MLLEHLDGELDEESSRRIEQHLAACRGCFTRAEFERHLRARIAEAGAVEAPASLRERIRFLIERF